MTDRAPGQRACPNGHPVRAAARFCPACGVNTAHPLDDLRLHPTGAAWPPPDGPAWPPPVAAQPLPVPGSRRVPWGLVTFVVVATLLLGVGGGAVVVYLNGRPGPTSGGTAAPPTAAPTTAAPPTADPAPSVIGIVDITAVREDTRAETVGTVLNEYFSGINDRDIPRVLAVMDPAGVVDRDDPRQVQQFRDNVSTTTDTDVVVHWIRADATTGGTQAGVTFTSRQEARYGPSGQTCSRWSLTYLLSSRFLIVRSVSSNEAC